MYESANTKSFLAQHAESTSTILEIVKKPGFYFVYIDVDGEESQYDMAAVVPITKIMGIFETTPGVIKKYRNEIGKQIPVSALRTDFRTTLFTHGGALYDRADAEELKKQIEKIYGTKEEKIESL
jgi:hypothetical protein